MANGHNGGAGPGFRNPAPFFIAEGINSVAGSLLTVGLPFFTSHRFGWGAKENFAMATCQGILYVLGALSAQRISGRWGLEKAFSAMCAGMTIFALAAGVSSSFYWGIAAVLFISVETGFMGASWPMLESLVSAAGERSQLSKRLGVYNITWACTGAISMAATGAMIQHSPAWVFFAVVALGHIIAGAFVLACAPSNAGDGERDQGDLQEPQRNQPIQSTAPVSDAVARRYKLALWLSRIALPSTYVIIFSLAPALPSLHAIKQLSPTIATVFASVWLVARTASFIFLGMTTFWHKRPLLMLGASIAMLFAFLGVIIPGASQIGLSVALSAMAIAQVVLGISIGAIYSSSLYFGMEMSDGSTEHGGYHEALIGLGQILGPAVGAAMQWIQPGDLWLSVIGISAVVAVSVVLEVVMGIRISSGKPQRAHTL